MGEDILMGDDASQFQVGVRDGRRKILERD